MHFRTDRGFGITVGLFYIFSYTQLDARSPKRSGHEDSDVQRDVNIRVHEGAIDSVAMRMIMFKKESGAGENNTPFDFVVFFVFIAPRAPQFQCCFVVGGAVAKRSVYFSTRQPLRLFLCNIEIGGAGGACVDENVTPNGRLELYK